jgi:hypothetical protein
MHVEKTTGDKQPYLLLKYMFTVMEVWRHRDNAKMADVCRPDALEQRIAKAADCCINPDIYIYIYIYI